MKCLFSLYIFLYNENVYCNYTSSRITVNISSYIMKIFTVNLHLNFYNIVLLCGYFSPIILHESLY